LLNIDVHGEAATRSGICSDLTVWTGGMNEDLRNAVSIHLRASLVPAAAVIPAQVAYFDVVAVKKLVVGWQPWVDDWNQGRHALPRHRHARGSQESPS
jgi:hypothetical protein